VTPEAPGAEVWTLKRVLTAMLDNERTGVLDVKSAGLVTRIHLRKGGVTMVERMGLDRQFPLADYLVESGRISSSELVEARQKCEMMDMPLDEYLVSKRLASEDLAKRYSDLHLADMLFPLFSRESLEIEFKDERPKSSGFATQLPISYVLKEAERRSGEWPELRRRVGSGHAVYTKDPAVLAELLGYVEPPEDDEEPLPELSGSARVVFFHVNGKKTVEQISRATGLGMYETYRGLRELLDAFLLEVETHEGVGEKPPSRSPLTRMVTYTTYALIAVLLGLGGQWVVSNPDVLTFDRAAGSASILSQVQRSHMAQVRMALEVYHAQKREYPESLDQLAATDMLASATVASMRNMRYTRGSGGYTLTGPGAASSAGPGNTDKGNEAKVAPPSDDAAKK